MYNLGSLEAYTLSATLEAWRTFLFCGLFLFGGRLALEAWKATPGLASLEAWRDSEPWRAIPWRLGGQTAKRKDREAKRTDRTNVSDCRMRF